MTWKKKRAQRKATAKKEPAEINDKEEAFLNFVDQNARQNSGFNECTADGGGVIHEVYSDSESSSLSLSSSSGSGGSFHTTVAFDELPSGSGMKRTSRKRGRPPKKGKASKQFKSVKAISSNVLNTSNMKGKQPYNLHQHPLCNKEELKASLAVIKKVMQMHEAASFCAPVDPISLGLPDYFDVIDMPMDFGTICNNIEKAIKYLTAEDVYKDVQYIWNNCLKYNKKSDYIVYLMKRVQKKFMKYWTAAGLQSETLGKTSGNPQLVSDDRGMNFSQHNVISMVSQMVGNLIKVQEDNFVNSQSQSQFPLSSHNEPNRSHIPQPSTKQPYLMRKPQPSPNQPYQTYEPQPISNQPYEAYKAQQSISQLYKSHKPQRRANQPAQAPHLEIDAYSNYAGNSHLSHSNNRTSRRNKHVATSMENSLVGSHTQKDNFVNNHPQSQGHPSSYWPYPSHQLQPSASQLPPPPSQLKGGLVNIYAGCSDLMPSKIQTTKYKRRNPVSKNDTIGGHLEQETVQAIQPQSQVPISSGSQLYQSLQPEPNTNRPPQLSPLHSIDNDLSDLSELPLPVDCTVKRKKYMTRSSVVPMTTCPTNSKQQQPQQSSNYLQQSPQSTFQPQLQPPCPYSDPSCFPVVDPSNRGREHGEGSSVGLDSRVLLQPSHPLPQPPSGSHSHPDQSLGATLKKKRYLGPAWCRKLWETHDCERIVVPVNKLGQPIGPEASKLGTFLGTIARNGEMAPLVFPDWFQMPDEYKEKMWQLVQAKFDIDALCKFWVLKNLASKWRDWKARLKAEHYYPHKTDEERIKDCDERVLPDQWPILISYWNSEEMQLRSAKNKANRACQKATHTAGRKSYARIREEERAKRPDGREPTRAELYIRTRTRKDGQPVNEEAADIIAKLREQETQNQQTSHDYCGLDDALSKALREEKSFPTLTDLHGRKAAHAEIIKAALAAKKSANEEVSKLMEKVGTMEQKYALMEAQIAKMTSSMQNFFDKMGESFKAPDSEQVHSNPNTPEDSPLKGEHFSSSCTSSSDECLLVDLRSRIEGEIGSFPYPKSTPSINMANSNMPGSFTVNPCNVQCSDLSKNNMHCNDQVYCLHAEGMDGKGIEAVALNGQGFSGCEFENLECLVNQKLGVKELHGCGLGNVVTDGGSSGTSKRRSDEKKNILQQEATE